MSKAINLLLLLGLIISVMPVKSIYQKISCIRQECTKKISLPKEGECYEYFLKGSKHTTHELRKIVKVDCKSKYDQIGYVFNRPSSKQHEKGWWYTLQGFDYLTLTKQQFFKKELSEVVVQKIECPWQ